MNSIVVILFLAGAVLFTGGLLLFAAGVTGTVSLLPFLGGLFLTITWGVIQRKKIREALKSRNTRQAVGQIILLFIVSVTLAFLLLVSSSHRRRFDFTQSSRYTLDSATRKVLDNLEEEVRLICCYGLGDMLWRQSNEKLIEQYSFASERVDFEFVNPTKEPEKVLLFKDELVEDALPAVFVRQGSRYERAKDAKEQNITNAIVRVTRKGFKSVYFLQGHGERDIHSTQDAYALGFVTRKLEEKGFRVRQLEMAGGTGVPEDCSVLVIAAPKTELQQFEVRAVEYYINNGGSVLLMLEPETVPELTTWLEQYGLRVGDDIVCETVLKRFMAGGRARGELSTSIRLTITPSMYPTYNDITRDFQMNTEYVGARSVSLAATAPPGIETEKVLETRGYMSDIKRQGSWGETNIALLKEDKADYNEGEDLPGPVTIAASALVGDNRGRLLVFGDGDFPTNGSRGFGGAQLFLNAVSSLSGEEDLVTVAHKSTEYTDLELSATQIRVMSTVAVFLWPLIIIVPGLLNWFKRRRA